MVINLNKFKDILLFIFFSPQRYYFFLNHANILTKLLILQQNKQKKTDVHLNRCPSVSEYQYLESELFCAIDFCNDVFNDI